MTDTVVSSASKEVAIGSGRPFVVIGERINPTGRKLLAEEMKNGDFSRVERDALAQVEAGAQMLDVNSGIPLADEPVVMAKAVELAPHGLTVNAIGPGYVATEMNTALVEDPDFDAMVVASTPVGRWGRPEEIAAAAVFLASDEASYVNGQTLLVDGGMTIAL